jgi:hypothetical protein
MHERRTGSQATAARRRGCVGAALALLAMTLSGCLSLKANSASQTAPGKVTIKAVVCASKYDAPLDWTDCQANNVLLKDNSRQEATQDGPGQVLVGFRVPAGAIPPPSFSSKDGATSFAVSPTYTSELQRLFPAPADQQWNGYISPVKEYKHTLPANRVGELNVDFGLPKSADGTPLPTFRWRQVVGFRQGSDENAPVVCGDDPIGKYCVDSPPHAQISDDVTTNVSDFGVLPGTGPTVYAGTTARVPFQLRYSDKASLGRKAFSLTATAALPNAGVLADPRSIDASPNSNSPASVLVRVPPGTPGGRYTVTLSAAIGSPPVTRANTATVFVQPLPPGPAPTPILSPVDNDFTTTPAGTKVHLLVVKKVPTGGVVSVRCLRGRGRCPFKSKTIKNRRTVKLTKLFRGRTLRPGTVLEVSITADRRIGKVVQYKVRKGLSPTKDTLCAPPGTSKPLSCE